MNIDYPCQYKTKGCPAIPHGANIITHQRYCDYAPARCPLLTCIHNWTGLRRHIKKHFLEHHPEHFHTNSKQKLVAEGFYSGYRVQEHYIMFEVHDRIFRCSWEVNCDNGLFYMAVYYLGQPNADGEFTYKVNFYKGDTDLVGASLMAPCEFSPEDGHRFNGFHYTMSSFDFLVKFCDKRGQLNYSIEITKNP